MPLRLRDDLHWCQTGGRIVFLDLAADRYFSLPRRAQPAFMALAAGDEPRDPSSLRTLIDGGFLEERPTADHFQQPASIKQPCRDLLHFPLLRIDVVPLLRALAWELRAAWQLKTLPLAEVLRRAAVRSANRGEIDASSEAETIAAAADAIAFATRAHDRCLVRAIAVHATCCARNVPAKLVIGVIAHPFAAHCWVQLSDAVLVGGYEQARLYAPILVIG